MTVNALSLPNRCLKRMFDIVFSLLGLLLTGWIILLAYIIACFDTKKSGLFLQERIGFGGKPFNVVKIRTMRDIEDMETTVTTKYDLRITRSGYWMRHLKIDELPQLWNVLTGEMSFVGPRPDVAGYADRLEGEDRILLQIKPGITGPATLKYRNEEEILSGVDDPEKYNAEVIWPDKVKINKQYIAEYSFFRDLKYIAKTVMG